MYLQQVQNFNVKKNKILYCIFGNSLVYCLDFIEGKWNVITCKSKL